MNIPRAIDFTGIDKTKVLYNGTKQYNILTNLPEENWNQYVNKMLSKNISVIYDAQADAFKAKPIKENKMTDNKYLLQDDDMDLESSAGDLNSMLSQVLDGSKEVEPEIETFEVPDAPKQVSPTTAEDGEKLIQVITLDDLQKILNQIGKGTAADRAEPEQLKEPPKQQNLTGTEDDLLSAFGQDEGGILSSEFVANADKIKNITDSEEASYLERINGLLGDIDAGDQGLTDKQPKQIAPSVSATDDEDGEVLDDDDSEEINEDYSEKDEYNYYGSRTGELHEDDMSMEDAPMITEEDGDEIDQVDDTEVPPMTVNKSVNMGGNPISIELNGVKITVEELKYVAESVKKSGLKLKAIKGTGKELKVIVEKATKQYTINYTETKYNTKTPFSIKHENFQTLDEALNRLTLKDKKLMQEQANFTKMLDKDIVSRSMSSFKDATILKEFDGKISKDYIPGWNVKSVGTVNLKTGLNEVYSNITEHTAESNTLVKTKDGQYFLLKGNLKERSEVGTKRDLVDIEGKKDYGTGQVIGIYENSAKGLGQIMMKIKRTSIPLLIWK